MNVGDVIPMKSCKASFPSIEFGFRANNARNGDRLFFLYLGSHNEKDGEFNADEVLKRMGWTPPEDV